MNFKHLLEQSLYVCPTVSNYYTVNSNWCNIESNVFGCDEVRPRIGTFSTPWGLQQHLFPVIDSTQTINKTINELLDQRASELFKTAKEQNKKIVIMWSGGIDSTTILSAFIKNLTTADLANIIVCASTESIFENSYFYRTQISNRFKMLHLLDLDISNDFLNKHILITGDPGDCITGPSTGKYSELITTNQHLASWHDNQHLLYAVYTDNKNPTFAKWWVDKVSTNLREIQEQGLFTQVVTVADWHWWQYYNLKYNGSMMRPFIKHKKNDKESITQENIQQHIDCTFFGHLDFQLWSYNNLHNLMPDGIKSHKREFKKYILELDGNTDYYNNKVKVGSWRYKNHGLMLIDNDCVLYRYNEPGLQEVIVEYINHYHG